MNNCKIKEIDSTAIIQLKVFLDKKKIILNISQTDVVTVIDRYASLM
jgi:hypothetical protein